MSQKGAYQRPGNKACTKKADAADNLCSQAGRVYADVGFI